MRSISGPRNRLILALASLLALLTAAWIAAAPLELADRWPGAERVLPHGDSTPASLVAAHQQWALPVAVVLSVLAVVIGIWLFLAQAPSRPATAPLRFSDEGFSDEGPSADGPSDGGGATLLGTLEPAVLERALSEHVQEVSGVLDASVRVSGSTTSPWVQASVTIAEDAETGWTAQSVRELLAEDVRTVLGCEARQIDLLIHLRTSGASSHSVVGTGARQGAPAGSGTAPA